MDIISLAHDLFTQAGITINGNQPQDIQVHNKKFYTRVLKETALGLGESYMDGWWDCDNLAEFINRILRARLDIKVKSDWKTVLYILKTKILNLQTLSRSKQVGKQHYDLGFGLFRSMLDKRMNYSSAYWKHANTLDEAQEAKLELVCRKLQIEPGMTLLDIGGGWGGFAKYAAEKYGARVVVINISKEQVKEGRELCKGLPVEFRLEDFRRERGTYDRVVSIGMFEHVGYKNYPEYMKVVHRCLKEDGIGLIHTIGNNYSITYVNAWTNKYIFPNGMLPSIAQISKAMEPYFVMEDWHNFGPDYDRTLMAWYKNFKQAWSGLKKYYDEKFFRMWRYFLLSSAGGFRSRANQLWQIVMTPIGRIQPDCRIS